MDSRVHGKSPLLSAIPNVTSTLIARTLLEPQNACARRDLMEVELHARMLMNVPFLVVVYVTPTLCVQTLKDPTSAAVYEVLKEMAETVQTLMNAQVLTEIPVTWMQCVPTLRALTFVAA